MVPRLFVVKAPPLWNIKDDSVLPLFVTLRRHAIVKNSDLQARSGELRIS